MTKILKSSVLYVGAIILLTHCGPREAFTTYTQTADNTQLAAKAPDESLSFDEALVAQDTLLANMNEEDEHDIYQPELSIESKSVIDSLRRVPVNFNMDYSKYSYIDPKHLVPDKPLKIALAHYDARKKALKNKNYLGVVDFTQFSGKNRFYIIDMRTGAVEAIPVAHGSGSDPNNTGYPTVFSNTPNSNMSSLGLYMTAETYSGKHGLSLRLDGLQSTNSNVRQRAVVVHSANYVRRNAGKVGRSWGCLAIEEGLKTRLINQLKEGSLIYTWYNQTQ